MPNYQYQCVSCDRQFFQSLPFGSKKEVPCPACKGKTKRLIIPPMVHFKGSGFYKNDSKPAPVEKKETPKTAEAKPVTAKNEAKKE